MDKRRRSMLVSSSDSDINSDDDEPSISFRPKQSRDNESPSLKRARIKPHRGRSRLANPSGHDITQGIGKRHSKQDTEPARDVPAQITPTVSRLPPIPLILPSLNPQGLHYRSSAQVRGSAAPANHEETSLGIPPWAYLSRLLPSNTHRPRGFSFTDSQSTLVKRELPETWKTLLASAKPTDQVYAIIVIYLCGAERDQPQCELCMRNSTYGISSVFAVNKVFVFPRCVFAADWNLSKLEQDLGISNGAAKQLCCNMLHQRYLARKASRKSHADSSLQPMPTSNKKQAEEEQPSPGIPVSEDLKFSSETSGERFDKKLRTPAKGGSKTIRAAAGSTNKTPVGRKGDFASFGSPFAPIHIGSSSDSASDPQVRRRRREGPPESIDRNRLPTPSPIVQHTMEMWEIAPGRIQVEDDHQAEDIAFSAPYLTQTRGIRVSDGVSFKVVDVQPGTKSDFAPEESKLRIFSVVQGVVQVSMRGKVFRIGQNGMWKLRAGVGCSVLNDQYARAVLHVSGIVGDVDM